MEGVSYNIMHGELNGRDRSRSMMATGTDAESESSQDYQTLHGVREEIVEKINSSSADVNALIAKALLRKLIQSVKASAAVAPGPQARRGIAEQFVAEVLEAVRADASGEKTELLLSVLESSALHDIAAYLRGKLRANSASDGSRRQEANGSPASPKFPRDMPKLEPAAEDSGVVIAKVCDNGVGNSATASYTEGSEDRPNDNFTQHQMTADSTTSGRPSKPVSAGVVVVEQDHVDMDNHLEEGTSTSPVADTQPHTHSPPMVSVLPEVKRMQQDRQDLQAKLAEKTNSEELLKDELKQVRLEKKDREEKLKEKDRELQAVKKEKDSQITKLKEQIGSLQVKIGDLQEELSSERKSNAAQIQKFKYELSTLKQEMEEKEEKYNKDKLRLTEEKHALEIQIERMHTKEERMKRQISDEQVKVAKQEKTCAELKAQISQTLVEKLEKVHQDSIAENEQLKKERQDSIAENEQLKKELRATKTAV